MSRFSADLAASWALSRASGDQLGAVLGRLGASWSRPGTASRRSWAVPGASWGVLEHLGDVLGASWGILEAFRDKFHEQLRFLIDFCRNQKNQALAAGRARFPEKTHLEVNMNFLCDFRANLVRFWRHFGCRGRVWRHLGTSWARLGASWRFLGASLARLESLLAHLGASWVHLGASLARPPAFGRLLARKTSQHKPV